MFLFFFNKFVLGGISLINWHLLVLDGHDSHVTIEAIDQAKEFGLDMIALPFHTSHDLETLNVFCFKPKLKQPW